MAMGKWNRQGKSTYEPKATKNTCSKGLLDTRVRRMSAFLRNHSIAVATGAQDFLEKDQTSG